MNKYILNSDIESKGKEFDYSWRDMAERIIELETEQSEFETKIEDLEKQINQR